MIQQKVIEKKTPVLMLMLKKVKLDCVQCIVSKQIKMWALKSLVMLSVRLN